MAIYSGLENALRAWRQAQHKHAAKVSSLRVAEANASDAMVALQLCEKEVAAQAKLSKERPLRYIDLGEGFLYRLEVYAGYSEHFSVTIIQPEN